MNHDDLKKREVQRGSSITYDLAIVAVAIAVLVFMV